MKSLAEFIKRNIIFKAYHNVPVSNIIYGEEKFYVKEGFGGQPIEKSPLYQFFYEYIKGDKEVAVKNFCDWYADQFEKYSDIDQKNGGMRFGSLYTLIEKKHLQQNRKFQDARDFDSDIVIEGIGQRVAERFALADSISKNGYIPDPLDPIIAIKIGEKYILREGHHRCCVIAALGENYCPLVFAPRGIIARYLFIYSKELKWFLRSYKFLRKQERYEI